MNINSIDDNNKIPLGQLLQKAHTGFQQSLLKRFQGTEWEALTGADLNLLASLNCGATHGSELARRLGISRQAVNKLLTNLVDIGAVELEIDPKKRNQKIIVITPKGESLIHMALEKMENLEEEIAQKIGEKDASELRRLLEINWGNSLK